MDDAHTEEPKPQQGAGILTKSAKRKKPTLAEILTVLVVTVAAIAIVIMIGIAATSDTPLPTQITAVREDVERLSSRIAKIETALSDIQRKLDAFFAKKDGGDIGVRLAAIQQDLNTTRSQVKTIESGLIDSPEKALSVPLLRKDLEALKDKYRSDVDRVYDQNKWFLTLVFTILFSLIGLGVSGLLHMRKKPDKG